MPYYLQARTLPPAVVVQDQLDVFAVDGYNRLPALVPGNFSLRLTYNNAVQAWPLVSGVGVQDTAVVAGQVYLDEVSTGYYRLRWFPSAPGAWRLEVIYAPSGQRTLFVYDIHPPQPVPSMGIHASFTK